MSSEFLPQPSVLLVFIKIIRSLKVKSSMTSLLKAEDLENETGFKLSSLSQICTEGSLPVGRGCSVLQGNKATYWTWWGGRKEKPTSADSTVMIHWRVRALTPTHLLFSIAENGHYSLSYLLVIIRVFSPYHRQCLIYGYKSAVVTFWIIFRLNKSNFHKKPLHIRRITGK